MKKKAIMLADTRPALIGHILSQIKATNDGLFDEAIIFYESDIPDTDKAIMRSFLPCRFIEYTPPLPDCLFDLPRFKRFSKLMFARYEMFNLINEYKSIVWLDTDILIQGDISRLLTLAEETGFAILREDFQNKSADKTDTMRSCFTEPISGFDLERPLCCTGTIVITEALKHRISLAEWCYNKTKEWAEVLNLPDQGVINALVQEFNIPIVPLGKNMAWFPSYGRDCAPASYVHAWGANKFWNNWYLQLKYPKWKEYYNEWISRGGGALSGCTFLPKVSIIIPTYQANFKYFKECLDSLVGQTQDGLYGYFDFEIIIIAEPQNEDELSRLIESYNDPRFVLIVNKERKGLSASLNEGLRIAKGEYIARIDDDDIAAATRLFKQKEYLDKHAFVNMCVSDYSYFGDMDEGRRIFEGNDSKAWSIFTCPFDHPTIMFRRAFFAENELCYNETMRSAEDWELWLRAYDKGMIVGCVHEELTRHRWHNGTAGQTDNTFEAMNKLAQSNFSKLGIEVSDDFSYALRPWGGKLNENDYAKLEIIFNQAILANKSLMLYDSESLRYVFNIRLEEARTGILPIVVTRKMTMPEIKSRRLMFRPFIKRLIMPLWRPIYHRFIAPLRRIESGVDNLQGQVLRIEALTNEVRELREMIEKQTEKISFVTRRLTDGERGAE
jgi:glycosyltransferase involved in cell wall biosynthesis